MQGDGGVTAAPLNAADLMRVFPSLADVAPVTGGTAGVCFRATYNNAPVFLKTQPNIAKEAAFMHAAHPDMPVILNGSWMMCPWMEPVTLTPQDIWTLVQDYQPRLEGLEVGDNIMQLLNYGFDALDTLDVRNDTSRALFEIFDELRSALPTMERVVCHGDLGPKNIMAWNGKPVAIDWEDVFMGVAFYDYLFWLTFFENRRYLIRSKPSRIEKAILALIVALKCELSYRLGAHRSNAMSFDQRIQEVLDLGD